MESLNEQRGRLIEALVRDRAGVAAFKIFRLLRQGKAEAKVIQEKTLLQMEETRRILHDLVLRNYVQVQEIPRTADHAPSKTFYLYSVRDI